MRGECQSGECQSQGGSNSMPAFGGGQQAYVIGVGNRCEKSSKGENDKVRVDRTGVRAAVRKKRTRPLAADRW